MHLNNSPRKGSNPLHIRLLRSHLSRWNSH